MRTVIGQDLWASYFTFAFVRNPWDLMVSTYNWWLQKAPRWESLNETVAEITAMGGFVGFMQSRYGSAQINEIEGNISGWITDGSGNIILDYVARFERLQEDWQVVCDGSGSTRFLSLTRTRASDCPIASIMIRRLATRLQTGSVGRSKSSATNSERDPHLKC